MAFILFKFIKSKEEMHLYLHFGDIDNNAVL